jgi:mannose-1-phosphate guanylyltransferase
MMSVEKAVVLVGGEGTRLRPLTLTTPKPLLPLMNRPFLHHVLDHLAAHGVREAVLSSPYLREAFEPFIESRSDDPKITWITETEPLGTGGAVLNALGEVGDGTFFVLNGDILTDLDLSVMKAGHEASGAAVSIATMQVADARSFGLVVTDDAGRVLAFREKPPEPTPGGINAGTYLIDAAALAGFARGVNTSIEREIFPALIGRGDAVHAYPEQCYWMDLGTPEKYLRAHFDLLEGKMAGEPRYSKPFLDPSADTDLRSQLGKWVVAGPGVHVGAGAEIEDSVLHENARVGEGAKVTNSILGPQAVVGPGATLSGVVAGAGAEIVADMTLTDAKVSAEPAG